ncbi:DUF4097 family beta strand repeat-containing protein [Streptomyces sp. DT24]|uniref:DUF4097 family beta strand repeat-containing protein n=1 Tax=Streptomyces sp. DT24 TaxID=3416520 RepID=UPI003CE739C8
MALRTRTLVVSGGAVLAALVLSGCGTTDVEDAPIEHKSFAFDGRHLTIDSGNAEVELVPADVTKIEVSRQVDGWVAVGNGPEGVWKLRDDTLTLQVKCSGIVSDCEALYRVKVPRALAVDVKADNGKVTATGFTTALDLRSDNGTVRVVDSSGPLSLTSDNGNIVAEGISAGPVSTKSDNGSSRLTFTGVPDRVEAVSDNGSITITLPSGKERYAVSTRARNGNVSVEVPRSDQSAHTVDVRSDNGQIKVRSAN